MLMQDVCHELVINDVYLDVMGARDMCSVIVSKSRLCIVCANDSVNGVSVSVFPQISDLTAWRS
jgi:hypothetical protein